MNMSLSVAQIFCESSNRSIIQYNQYFHSVENFKIVWALKNSAIAKRENWTWDIERNKLYLILNIYRNGNQPRLLYLRKSNIFYLKKKYIDVNNRDRCVNGPIHPTTVNRLLWLRQVLGSPSASLEVKQGGRTHLWQEFDCFMWDGMIDDNIESYWAITDKKHHKQGQKLWFSALVLPDYWNAIAQN